MDDDLYREKAILAQKVQVFHSCNDMLPNQAKTKQEYSFKQFKKFCIHKATIYRWLKEIEQKVHTVNQNGLQSL